MYLRVHDHLWEDINKQATKQLWKPFTDIDFEIIVIRSQNLQGHHFIFYEIIKILCNLKNIFDFAFSPYIILYV